MDSTIQRYSTGLPFLDYRIDGGLTVGGLLAITAPPQAQSALLLRQLITERKTHFVSTLRPAEEVHRWAEAGQKPPADLTVVASDPTTLLEDPALLESQISPESFVIFDRMNGLEATSRTEYLEFLNALKQIVRRTESVGVLRCADPPDDPPQRSLTLDRVDQVWQVELLALTREIKSRLLVTKSRTGRALREPIDLLLTDRVEVDTSRSIG